MTEKIRKPRKAKPTNPARAPAPEVPAPVPAPKAALGSYGVPSIDKHDALFVAASRAVEAKKGVVVPPRFLKAVMGLESGEDGDYPVDRCRPSDGHPGPRSCGPMQIKWPYHEHRCPECSRQTVAGHVEMAGHVIADAMQAHRCDEYEAYVRGYLTSDDVNGTSQREAVAGLRRRVKAMEADAATGTTPTPETTPAPKPTDPLSVIVGGVPYTAEYGFDDQGPAYYAYFDRAHGNDTDDDTSHPGVDVMVPLGTKLYAPAAGVVTCVGAQGRPTWGQGCGYYADTITGGVGNITVLLDAGPKLVLGHSKSCRFKVGDRVKAGDWVGTSGGMNSPHVHVEVAVKSPTTGEYWIVDPVKKLREVMGGAPVGTTPAPRPAPIVYDLADPADAARFELSPKQAAAIRAKRIPGRAGYRPQAIVWHVQDGNTRGSLSHWLTVNASANVMIQRDGSILRVVPDEDGPWTNGDVKNPDAWGRALAALGGGDPNNVSLTIEYEGEAGQGLTPAQEAAGLWQTERWMDRWGIPLSNVGGHYQINSVDRAHCPGPAVMASKAKLRGGSGTTPAPAKRFPVALPDAAVLALFPYADPSPGGRVTAMWIESGMPPFIRRADGDDAFVYWIFTTLTLRSKDGTVEEVTP